VTTTNSEGTSHFATLGLSMLSARLLVPGIVEMLNPKLPKCVTATSLQRYVAFRDFETFQHKFPLTSCPQNCRKAKSRNAEICDPVLWPMLFLKMLSGFRVSGLRDSDCNNSLPLRAPSIRNAEIRIPETSVFRSRLGSMTHSLS
jgi:hypothetical protein